MHIGLWKKSTKKENEKIKPESDTPTKEYIERDSNSLKQKPKVDPKLKVYHRYRGKKQKKSSTTRQFGLDTKGQEKLEVGKRGKKPALRVDSEVQSDTDADIVNKNEVARFTLTSPSGHIDTVYVKEDSMKEILPFKDGLVNIDDGDNKPKVEGDAQSINETNDIIYDTLASSKPETKTDEKTDEKFEEKVDDKTDEILDEENVEEKVVERIEKNVQEKPHEILEEKVQDKPDKKFEEKVDDKSHKKFEEKVDDKTDEILEEKAEQKVVERIEENVQEKPDEKLEEKMDHKTGDLSSADTSVKLDGKLEEGKEGEVEAEKDVNHPTVTEVPVDDASVQDKQTTNNVTEPLFEITTPLLTFTPQASLDVEKEDIVNEKETIPKSDTHNTDDLPTLEFEVRQLKSTLKERNTKIEDLEKQVTKLDILSEENVVCSRKMKSLTKLFDTEQSFMYTHTQKNVALVQEIIKLQNELELLRKDIHSKQKEIKENKKKILEMSTVSRSSTNPKSSKKNINQQVQRLSFELQQAKKENSSLQKEMEQFHRETQTKLTSKDAIISELISETNAALKQISKCKWQSLLESNGQDIAKEIADEMHAIKMDYFYALALSIKMSLAMGGVTPNLLLDDLYPSCESLDWRTWKAAVHHAFIQKLEQEKSTLAPRPNIHSRTPITSATTFSRSIPHNPLTTTTSTPSPTTDTATHAVDTSSENQKEELTNLAPLAVVE